MSVPALTLPHLGPQARALLDRIVASGQQGLFRSEAVEWVLARLLQLGYVEPHPLDTAALVPTQAGLRRWQIETLAEEQRAAERLRKQLIRQRVEARGLGYALVLADPTAPTLAESATADGQSIVALPAVAGPSGPPELTGPKARRSTAGTLAAMLAAIAGLAALVLASLGPAAPWSSGPLPRQTVGRAEQPAHHPLQVGAAGASETAKQPVDPRAMQSAVRTTSGATPGRERQTRGSTLPPKAASKRQMLTENGPSQHASQPRPAENAGGMAVADSVAAKRPAITERAPPKDTNQARLAEDAEPTAVARLSIAPAEIAGLAQKTVSASTPRVPPSHEAMLASPVRGAVTVSSTTAPSQAVLAPSAPRAAPKTASAHPPPQMIAMNSGENSGSVGAAEPRHARQPAAAARNQATIRPQLRAAQPLAAVLARLPDKKTKAVAKPGDRHSIAAVRPEYSAAPAETTAAQLAWRASHGTRRVASRRKGWNPPRTAHAEPRRHMSGDAEVDLLNQQSLAAARAGREWQPPRPTKAKSVLPSLLEHAIDAL